MSHRELREAVARTAREMSSSGLVTGTAGNVSARTPEGAVLITPSGLDYAQLEAEDAVLVTLDGRTLEGRFEPSTETPMHTGIYRQRPEVGAVVHTHARFSTTLACLGWPIEPVHYMLVTLAEDGRVPLAGYATYGTDELAGYAGDALGGSRKACLLRNHGTITVGDGPEDAFARTVVLEEMAEVYYRARLAGEPVLLTREQLAEVAAKISGYGQAKPAPKE